MEDQDVSNFIRKRTEIPDMSNWHNKIDVTYSVSTYFFLSNFNTTTVTMIPLILLYFPQAHSKSFTGPNSFTEKTITLRLVRTVVIVLASKLHLLILSR
jgi:hypothetical protein